MLLAAAWRSLTPALLLLFVGGTGVALCALEDATVVSGGPATTGVCEEPVALEPGVMSVHCTSPPIPMAPGQVCSEHYHKPSAARQQAQQVSHPVLDRPQQQATKGIGVPVQVININLLYPNPFPADQTLAIINQTAQLIHVADRLPVIPNEVRHV